MFGTPVAADDGVRQNTSSVTKNKAGVAHLAVRTESFLPARGFAAESGILIERYHVAIGDPSAGREGYSARVTPTIDGRDGIRLVRTWRRSEVSNRFLLSIDDAKVKLMRQNQAEI
jgi:hypothetical protein